MGLRDRVAEYAQPFEAVLAIAICRDSLGFLDLQWPPFDIHGFLDRQLNNRDPGVTFETTTRVMVVEEHAGELRFYAGGRGDALFTEPYESGVFHSPEAAILYAEAFLSRQLHPQRIEVRRRILSAKYDWGNV